MKRNGLFSKLIAGLLCVMMVVGLVPASVFAASADDYESDIDVFYGTKENPIEYTLTFNDENTVGSYTTVSQAANEELYYSTYVNGSYIFSVTGEGDFSVLVNGETIAAVDGVVSLPVTANPRAGAFVIAITNTSAAAAAYEIAFAIPEGDMNNPVALELGWNDVTLAENSQGYFYTWTATATGDLSFELGTCTEGVVADIVINNLNSYVNKTLLADGAEDDFGAMVVTMPVTAGDEVMIQVVAVPDAETYVAPAAAISHYSAFTYPLGSEQNPIQLLENENDLSNEGTMYYKGYFNGMIMTVTGEDFSVIYNGDTIAAVDGVVSIPVSSANPRMPVIFAIVGDGDFSVDFTYPVGSMENPAVAVLGDNLAKVSANSQMGYIMTYTAEKAGNLIVTISGADNWTYVINNLTAGTYGDTQWSDSDPVVNPATITVAEGDEIQIMVNGYNPADMWNTPAANITVNLAYKEPAAPPTKLRISGVNLALMSDLKVNFYVPTAAMETYENVYFVLNVADREVIVSEGKDVGDKYQFALTGMPPRMMNDTIDIKLYGTYDGVVYEYTNTYKIATYCYNQIRKASNAATVKTMLVDLLNFGAAHQVYGNHNLENMVNADLTDEEKALASSYEQKFTNVLAQTGTNNGASFRGASLVLSDAIVIRYSVQCDDLTDVTFRATVDGVTHVIDASEFQLVAGTTNRYTIDFNKLTARQMSEIVAAGVYRGEEAISKTATYSIESYAAGKDVNDGSALGNLVKYMMYYGYACVANQAG